MTGRSADVEAPPTDKGAPVDMGKRAESCRRQKRAGCQLPLETGLEYILPEILAGHAGPLTRMGEDGVTQERTADSFFTAVREFAVKNEQIDGSVAQNVEKQF